MAFPICVACRYWALLPSHGANGREMQDGLDDLLRDVVDDIGPIRVRVDSAERDCQPEPAVGASLQLHKRATRYR